MSLVKGEVTNQVVVSFFANGLIEGFGFVKFELDADGTVATEILLSDLNVRNQQNGFEVVALWQSMNVSQSFFFSDSNGLELIKRFNVIGIDQQNVPASTYPGNTMIGIIDDNNDSFTVIMGQSGGVTSKPSRGLIEVFLQRKTNGADFGGMGLSVSSKCDLSAKFKTKYAQGRDLATLYDEQLI